MHEMTYSQTTSLDPAATIAIGAGVFIFALIFFVIVYVIGSWLLGKIFKKAGVASWKAWVPVYNNWVLLELGGQKGFWILLAFIPVVNIVTIVFYYIALYDIGLKLGKSGAFVLLGIFLPIVWLIWLAFDDSKWLGTNGAAEQSPISPLADAPTDQNNTPPSPPPLVQ